MALDKSALCDLLAALRAGGDLDVVRSGLRLVLQALIELEATEVIGAQPYERRPERTTHRNGHRARLLSTKAGDVELRIPKLRQGAFFPALLEPRRRIDRALWAVVMESYVHGVSTRKVDDLVRALGIDAGISKSEVSRVCAELDEHVGAFRDRSLGHAEFPDVFLDATDLKAHEGPHVVSQAVVMATGVRRDGGREVLGLEVGDSEDGAFWTAFLRSLRARGLAGVQLVISDAHEGLKAAIAAVLVGSSWQRCRTHCMRNVLARVPTGSAEMVAAAIHHLRPAGCRGRSRAAGLQRREARAPVPGRGADAPRRRPRPHRLRSLSAEPLAPGVEHEPLGARQRRDQAPGRRGWDFPQRGGHPASGGRRAPGDPRRVADRRAALPLGGLHGRHLRDQRATADLE